MVKCRIIKRRKFWKSNRSNQRTDGLTTEMTEDNLQGTLQSRGPVPHWECFLFRMNANCFLGSTMKPMHLCTDTDFYSQTCGNCPKIYLQEKIQRSWFVQKRKTFQLYAGSLCCASQVQGDSVNDCLQHQWVNVQPKHWENVCFKTCVFVCVAVWMRFLCQVSSLCLVWSVQPPTERAVAKHTTQRNNRVLLGQRRAGTWEYGKGQRSVRTKNTERW